MMSVPLIRVSHFLVEFTRNFPSEFGIFEFVMATSTPKLDGL
jgi:hypothetical protein